MYVTLIHMIMVVRTLGKPGIHLEFDNSTWNTWKTWNLHEKSLKNTWNLRFFREIFILLKF